MIKYNFDKITIMPATNGIAAHIKPDNKSGHEVIVFSDILEFMAWLEVYIVASSKEL